MKKRLVLIIVLTAQIVLLVFGRTSVSVKAAPFGLGSATTTSNSVTCPIGAACTGLKISCPSLQQVDAVTLAEFNPASSPRGTVLFFTGGGGTSWYKDSSPTTSMFNSLVSSGLRVIEAAWQNPWTSAADGERAGIVKLACRPATTIKWVYDNKYAPLGVQPDKVGKCGFCVTGNSGGSAQTMYSLGYYGLDNIINAAIPSSGPPYAAMTKGCLGQGNYAYDAHSIPRLDNPYGFLSGNGPCETKNATWTSYWNADSIDITANDNYFPTTRVAFLLGGNDLEMQAHVSDYYPKLSGTPYLSTYTVPNGPHELPDYGPGANAILAAILADTGVLIIPPAPGGGASSSPAPTSTPESTTSNPTSSTNSNPQATTTSSLPKVSGISDVPGAVLHAITNPSDTLQIAKQPYGWLIVIVLFGILSGLGAGSYILFQKNKHRLPDKWHFIQKSKSLSGSPANDMPAAIVQPSDSNDNQVSKDK